MWVTAHYIKSLLVQSFEPSTRWRRRIKAWLASYCLFVSFSTAWDLKLRSNMKLHVYHPVLLPNSWARVMWWIRVTNHGGKEMGRRPELTVAQRTELVLQLLRREETGKHLARRAGISEQTLNRWRDDFIRTGRGAGVRWAAQPGSPGCRRSWSTRRNSWQSAIRWSVSWRWPTGF